MQRTFSVHYLIGGTSGAMIVSAADRKAVKAWIATNYPHLSGVSVAPLRPRRFASAG